MDHTYGSYAKPLATMRQYLEKMDSVPDEIEPGAPRRAHTHLEGYSKLPNYRKSWLRQGFDESDVVVGGSDRLADGVVAMGDAEAVGARVREHFDAGADHVVIQVLGDSRVDDPLPTLSELAPTLQR